MDATVRGVTDAVRALASDAIRSTGAELVDLEFRREPAGWVLRLFIDKSGGVGIDDCQRVSQVVGTLLEVEDPVPHAYTLEVSSPGLTRPLSDAEDWQHAVGGQVKVVTREPVEGMQSLTGRLVDAGPDGIGLEVQGDTGAERIEIAYDLITRGRMELDWPAPAPVGGGEKKSRSRKGSKRGRKQARRR